MEMFKIMKGVDKIVQWSLSVELTVLEPRAITWRVKKMRDRTVLRQGSFSRRVVNVRNGLPGKVVATEGWITLNGI